MKTRSTVALLCALLTLSACEANTGPEVDADFGTFEATSNSSAAGLSMSLSGAAQSGFTQGGFTVLLQDDDVGSGKAALIGLQRAGAQPAVGTYNIGADPTNTQDFAGIVLVGTQSALSGEFEATSGTVTVTQSTAGNFAGEFNLTASGTANGETSQPAQITVSGKFNARNR